MKGNTEPDPEMVEFHRLMDEIRGRMTRLHLELEQTRSERNKLRSHYEATAPEHNLLALLDLYKARAEQAEAQIDRLLKLCKDLLPHVEV